MKWIKILYRNISSCVVNNGSSCKYFPVERGVRQGDPLSPYLFLLVIEMLAIKIRLDKELVGFRINQSIHKLTLYADDMTLAVQDLKSAKRAFALLKLFSDYSGLKINVEKTEGMWLGRQKENLQEPLGIAWPKSPVKALGIFHSYNKASCIKANFDDKIDKLIKQLHWWKARKLSLTGKILIVKTLGISKFALIASLLHIPETLIKKVNTIIYNFIWNGRSDKVKRKIIIQDYDKGGLKMINFDIYVKAAKCKWIQRYLDSSNASWKNLFQYFCKKENLDIFLRSNFDLNELPKTLPSYYYDSISCWNNLKQSCDDKVDFIWYNKRLKINNKTVYNQRLFKAGIWCTEDLFENGNPIPFKTWLKRGAIQIDFMTWRGLIHSILIQRDIRRFGDINRGLVRIKGSVKEIDILSQKDFRECLNGIEMCSLKQIDFKAKNKFRLIHGAILEDEWKKVFSSGRSVKVSNYVKDVQFKIMHRYLATNSLLFKMKKVASPRCDFCQLEEESIEHLIFNCNFVKSFWIDVFNRWNNICATTYVIGNLKLVTFGIYVNESKPEQNAFNFIILVGKAYIWKCKQSKCLPLLQLFKQYITQTIEVCHQVIQVLDLINMFIDEVIL